MDSVADFHNPTDEMRPWGAFRVLVKNEPVTVKIITVRSGQAFSLQKHQHRTEFWRILSGSAEVSIGEKTVVATVGDEYIVPVGTLHRVTATAGDVQFLEIASGLFSEDDIVRVADNYGRV